MERLEDIITKRDVPKPAANELRALFDELGSIGWKVSQLSRIAERHKIDRMTHEQLSEALVG